MGLGDLLGGGGDMKQAPEPKIKETPWGPQNRNFLQGLVNGTMPLQGTAQMSEAEKAGMSNLMAILSGAAFADPNSSQYYQGMRNSLKNEEAEGVSALRRRAQSTGMARSGGAMRAEGDYRSKMANQRNTLLGGLYESERARDNPYTRLTAAMNYGSLPRQIAQQELNAKYNQAMGPYTTQAQIAQNLLGYQPWYQPQYYQSSSGSNGAAGIGALAGMAAGSFIPGVGTMLGGQVGGALGGLFN